MATGDFPPTLWQNINTMVSAQRIASITGTGALSSSGFGSQYPIGIGDLLSAPIGDQTSSAPSSIQWTTSVVPSTQTVKWPSYKLNSLPTFNIGSMGSFKVDLFSNGKVERGKNAAILAHKAVDELLFQKVNALEVARQKEHGQAGDGTRWGDLFV